MRGWGGVWWGGWVGEVERVATLGLRTRDSTGSHAWNRKIGFNVERGGWGAVSSSSDISQ